MKSLFIILMLSILFLTGCGGSQVYVGAEAGPVDVIISVNNNGIVAVSGSVSPKFKVGLGPIELKVGIQQTLELTKVKPFTLFVLWDENGEIQRNEYEIGRSFHVKFTQNEFIQEIQGDNNSVVVAVKKPKAALPTPEPKVVVVVVTSVNPTSIPNSSSRIYNFTACLTACNGSNSITNFPKATKKVYVQWNYENIPYGARYVRKWTMNGEEWIKYDCTWTGNESGHDSVKLTEPKGLHSGIWELTIIVDDEVLLREKIKILGNWDYWDPAETLYSCYGVTD